MDEFMQLAISMAKKGHEEGGIPIGSVLVRDNKVLSTGYNQRVQNANPMAHAEIDCLKNAGRLGSYKNTVLYSTLMPCYLCAGAVVQFGIKKIIVGESETFKGAKTFMLDHDVEVIDLNNAECIEIMKVFIDKNPKLWNEDIGRE